MGGYTTNCSRRLIMQRVLFVEVGRAREWSYAPADNATRCIVDWFGEHVIRRQSPKLKSGHKYQSTKFEQGLRLYFVLFLDLFLIMYL